MNVLKRILYILMIGIPVFLALLHLRKVQPAVFVNLNGPNDKSIVEKEVPTPWQNYEKGSTSRLAVLLTDDQSNWLPLAHGLKTIGIPFVITQNFQTAFQHPVVIVYPLISGRVLPESAFESLSKYVEGGGTVIAQSVLGGGLERVFGIKSGLESDKRTQLRYQASEMKKILPLSEVRELLLPLGSAEKNNLLSSVEYSVSTAAILAKFENGAGAILCQSFGKGKAYALGIDIGQLLHKGYANREESIARAYVNSYEPAIDVMLLFLKEIYVHAKGGAVTLGTVPEGKNLAVMVTHDIDYTKALENLVTYAQVEKSLGIQSTAFMQTKYIRDFDDDIFFSPVHIPLLKTVSDLGMEIGSHTVSHSRQFAHFPIGTGEEDYPSYAPFIRSVSDTKNGTVLGELRVSKFLIESLIDPLKIVSFRPGNLSNPYVLPQALTATGFHYSSSVTANNSLTHLPFQLTWGRNSVGELPIFEFPVTIEDEANTVSDRLDTANQLAEKLSTYGGTFVILVHPSILGEKLKFVSEFTKAWKGRAWFGTVAKFGEWWSARNQIGVDEEVNSTRRVVHLNIPKHIAGLVVHIPQGWRPSEKLGPGVIFRNQDLIFENAHGKIDINFSKL